MARLALWPVPMPIYKCLRCTKKMSRSPSVSGKRSSKVARTTTTRDVVVEEDLRHEQIVVERLAIGRVVEAVPPIRQEGDVTILSVVEEIVVTERRLVLREEVHLRRVRRTEHHVETIKVREQGVAITRSDVQD